MFLFQIEPYKIAENSFWVKAEENKFESPELFARLAVTFGTQMKGTSNLSHAYIKFKAVQRWYFYSLYNITESHGTLKQESDMQCIF